MIKAVFTFRLSSEVSSQRHDDRRANAERVIPVHISFSDENQKKPVAGFERLRQTEEPRNDDSSINATQHSGVTEQEQGSSDLSKPAMKTGDFNAGIRDESVQGRLLRDDLNFKPTKNQNEYKEAELIPGENDSNFEGQFNNNDAELNQDFSKSENRDVTKQSSGDSHEKKTSLNPEVNIRNKETSTKEEALIKEESMGKANVPSNSETAVFETGISTGRTFLPRNTGQPTNAFENPILTYLTKQQSSDIGSTISDSISKEMEDSTSQTVRRQIFHQQTAINPDPSIYQFLQQQLQTQQTNPAFYQGQHPSAQPQLNSLPNKHFYTYPAHSQSPRNEVYTGGSFHGQNNQNTLDPIHDEAPQFPSTLGHNHNFVTTLTLYPAIASVTYSTPATGLTSSVPLPYTPYQSETSSPYMQSFVHQPFRGVASPVNLPNTKLLFNGPQYSSRIQWPLANYFPIVIKDPFHSMYNMFISMVEYGPEADICKKTKSFRQGRNGLMASGEEESEEEVAGKILILENGGWKEISKNGIPLPMERKVPEDVKKEDKAESNDKKDRDEERKKKDEDQNTEIIMESGGNGNAGPYITRLMVRKGGVSIAGPGGIATAGSGGTAIVGPGGVAYTSPNGLAVVGPGGKVVGLPTGADLSMLAREIATSGPKGDGTAPRLVNIPPGGKVLATGPVVYFHPPE